MKTRLFGAMLAGCAAAFALAGSGAGCKGGAAPDSLRVDKLNSDTTVFLLVRILPLGLSFQEAQKRLPSLSVLPETGNPDDTGGMQSTASGNFRMQGREVTMQCRLTGGMLASYTCSVSGLEKGEAEVLHRQARRVYTMTYGNFHEAIQTDPLHITNHWSSDAFVIRLELSGADTLFSLKWGFDPLPHQPEPQEESGDEEPLAAYLIIEDVT